MYVYFYVFRLFSFFLYFFYVVVCFPSQVVVNVQFPKVVRTADLHVTLGTCLFDEALKVQKTWPNTLVLRGAIVNRTHGLHKSLPGIYSPFFTHNIWSYLLWSPVILLGETVVNRAYGIHKNLYI